MTLRSQGSLTLTTPGMVLNARGANIVYARVRDADHLAVQGCAVRLSAPAGSEVHPSTAHTDGNSVARFTVDLKGTGIAGGASVSLTAESVLASATARFTVNDPHSDSTVLACAAATSFGWTDGHLFERPPHRRFAPPPGLQFPGPVTDICDAPDGGETLVVALSDGSVWTSGKNTHGQLGDGTTSEREGWGRVLEVGGVVRVATSQGTVYALSDSGTVFSWGSNRHGELGRGNGADGRYPGLVPGMTDVAQIAAGRNSAYVRRADGSVWAWGANARGELGTGSRSPSFYPTPVIGAGEHVQQIAAADSTVYARLRNGRVLAWGDGTWGRIGDGRPWAWLETGSGRTKTFEWEDALLPVEVQGLPRPAVSIAASARAGYALLDDGTVWAWGENGRGGCDGSAATLSRDAFHAPVQVRDLQKATEIHAEKDTVIVRVADGRLFTIGSVTQTHNWRPSSCDFGFVPAPQLPPSDPDSTPITELSAAFRGNYVLLSTRRPAIVLDVLTDVISSVGRTPLIARVSSRSGAAIEGEQVSFEVVDGVGRIFMHMETVTSNATGRAIHTAVLDHDQLRPGGRLYLKVKVRTVEQKVSLRVTGSNLWEISGGMSQDVVVTHSTANFPSEVVSAVMGGKDRDEFALALLADGSVWAKGQNGLGQLGDGSIESRRSWSPVSGLTEGASAIAAGQDTAYAVLRDGTLWTWGNIQYFNPSGEYPHTRTHVTVPVRVSTLPGTVKAVACAAHTAYAITDESEFGAVLPTVYAWGLNDRGQAGVGSEEDAVFLPTALRLLSRPDEHALSTGGSVINDVGPVASIFAGADTGYAVMTSGRVLAWGANDRTQVGCASYADARTPAHLVVTLTKFTAVKGMAAGENFACGATESLTGGMLTWGDDDFLQPEVSRPINPGIPSPRLTLLWGQPFAAVSGVNRAVLTIDAGRRLVVRGRLEPTDIGPHVDGRPTDKYSWDPPEGYSLRALEVNSATAARGFAIF